MRELFKDIMDMDGVKGLFVFSAEGEMIINEIASDLTNPEEREWGLFIDALKDMNEVELIFDDNRIYIRKAETRYLMVVMDTAVQMSMLRLNCDILIPALKGAKGKKGLRGFFKR